MTKGEAFIFGLLGFVVMVFAAWLSPLPLAVNLLIGGVGGFMVGVSYYWLLLEER